MKKKIVLCKCKRLVLFFKSKFNAKIPILIVNFILMKQNEARVFKTIFFNTHIRYVYGFKSNCYGVCKGFPLSYFQFCCQYRLGVVFQKKQAVLYLVSAGGITFVSKMTPLMKFESPCLCECIVSINIS